MSYKVIKVYYYIFFWAQTINPHGKIHASTNNSLIYICIYIYTEQGWIKSMPKKVWFQSAKENILGGKKKKDKSGYKATFLESDIYDISLFMYFSWKKCSFILFLIYTRIFLNILQVKASEQDEFVSSQLQSQLRILIHRFQFLGFRVR